VPRWSAINQRLDPRDHLLLPNPGSGYSPPQPGCGRSVTTERFGKLEQGAGAPIMLRTLNTPRVFNPSGGLSTQKRMTVAAGGSQNPWESVVKLDLKYKV
jgi:hypothetical protein